MWSVKTLQSLHHWAMEPISNEIFLDRPRTKYDFSSWRVLKTACLMLNVASLAALEVYGRHVEKLVTQWPSAWGLIYQAEDAARAERMAKLRRQFTVESGLGRQVPRDWNPKEPWSCIFVSLCNSPRTIPIGRRKCTYPQQLGWQQVQGANQW